MTSRPIIRTYRLLDAQTSLLASALEILQPHLPESISLYQRLQFGHFHYAATLISNLDLLASPSTSQQWLLAFVDRSARPESQAWIFGSWDAKPASSGHVSRLETDETLQDQLVLSLGKAVKSLGVPESAHQHFIHDMASGADKATYLSSDDRIQMFDTSIVSCGGIPSTTTSILQRTGLVSHRFKSGTLPYRKYMFDLASMAGGNAARDLPAGLQWGPLETRHYELIRDRIHVPRQDSTLAVMRSIGVFCEQSDDPVAWSFLGLDGSVTSLFIEPRWRGKGLAKVMTAELLRGKMDSFWGRNDERLAHALVSVDNEASSRMCESLGGVDNGLVYRLRIDLSNLSPGS